MTLEKEFKFDIDYKNLEIFSVKNEDNIKFPIVLSSPHSGSVFPKGFEGEGIALSNKELRTSEDSFVNELIEKASDHGMVSISMNISRAFIDVNRDKIEIDESMYFDFPHSTEFLEKKRCRVGLGVIPRVVAPRMPIYNGLISHDDAMQRIENVYEPYHKKLKQLIDKVVRKFGYCLLVDCHSMPSKVCRIMEDEKQVDFCIGNLFNQSCEEKISEKLCESLSNEDHRVELNRPYSGGFITHDFCQPRKKIQSIQIEINRDLYMNEGEYSKKPDFSSLSTHISNSIIELSQFLVD